MWWSFVYQSDLCVASNVSTFRYLAATTALPSVVLVESHEPLIGQMVISPTRYVSLSGAKSRPPDMFVTTNVAVATETPTWPGEEPPMLIVVMALRPVPLPAFATVCPLGVEPIATGATSFTFGLASTAVTVYPPVIVCAQVLIRLISAARIESRCAVVLRPVAAMLALPAATVTPLLKLRAVAEVQRRFVP